MFVALVFVGGLFLCSATHAQESETNVETLLLTVQNEFPPNPASNVNIVQRGSSVLITWDKNPETPWFEVLRSTDGITYEPITVLAGTMSQYIDTPPANVSTVAYRVDALNWGHRMLGNPYEISPHIPAVALIEKGNISQIDFQLYQNFPNPFNPETTIQYSLAQASDVTLTIYNPLGQVVRTLVQDHQSMGNYTISWNGNDNRGTSVASGVYLYALHAGTFKEIRRLMLVK